MIISFFVGIALMFVYIFLSFFPGITNLLSGVGTSIQSLVSVIMPWQFILPIRETFAIVYRVIQFQFGIMLLFAGKWLVEFVRGK